MNYDYDIIIIGAGPAGYTAAIEAGKNGFSTLVIDKDKIGGTCLNYGCIPTKVLYTFAETIYLLKKQSNKGIDVKNINIEWKKIKIYKKEVISRLIKGIEFLFKKYRVNFIKDKAEIIDSNNVRISNKILKSKFIIIATGSKSHIPDSLKEINNNITIKQLWEIDNMPSSITIFGGGVIGTELASILSTLGVKIYLIEKLPSILYGYDEEVIKIINKNLKKNNVELITDFKDINITDKNEIIIDDKKIKSEKVLIATGRIPLLPEKIKDIGVELNNNFIEVNQNYESTIKNIFAIGDVINKDSMFAHTAEFQAKQLINYLKGKNYVKYGDYYSPATIFTFPQISIIGKNENYLKSKKIKYKKLFSSYIANSFGKITELRDGFLKILLNEDNNKIYGVTVISHNSNEIINLFSTLKNLSLPFSKLKQIIFTHPSESELIKDLL